jgi:hypothetical protein
MVVLDDMGDSNGVIDPGEQADLVFELINHGDAGASGVTGSLETDDDYLTVLSGTSTFGDIPSGAHADNSDDPFVVEASSSTPSGHYAWMNLVLSTQAAEYEDTLGFWLKIGRPSGNFLIYDVDMNTSSGPILRQTLEDLGYVGHYMTEITEVRNYLFNFDAVFVCVGIYPNDFMFPSGSADAESLVSYLENHGGNLYLEGGDVWYYHPSQGGFNFRPYFNINATADGSSDLSTVLGQSGTFTEGMNFLYEGENNWIDHIEPITPAVSVLRNQSPAYGCAVAHDEGTYRTVGASFELTGLRDGADPSSKAALLDSIMGFFGVSVLEMCGDVNGDESITPGDGYGILNYLGAGPQPASCYAANVNGDGALTPGDGFQLLNYLGAGPGLTCAPCELMGSTGFERKTR